MNEKYNEQGIKVCCENCEWWENNPNGGCNGWPCSRISKNHTTDETQPSSEAYEARLDELTAFVQKVAKAYLYEWDDNLVEYLPSNFRNEARALLRGESEDGK